MLTPQHCADLCRRRGTGQCALICLSHSSNTTTRGNCPEAINVWGSCDHANARKVRQFNDEQMWHCDRCHLNFTTRIKTMSDDRPFNTKHKPTTKAVFELLERLRDRGFEFDEIAPPPEGDTRPIYNVTVKDQDIADAHDLIDRLMFGRQV